MSRILASSASLALLLASACSDGASTSTGGAGGAAASSSSSSTSASSSSGSGGAGAAPPAPSFVAHFDPAKGELPEGLVLSADGAKAYVGMAALGKVVAVTLADGAVTDFGSVPAPPMNAGFMLGLALDAAGDLYVGVASFSPTYQPGVYKIPKAGGAGALYISDPAMVFPNGLAFDGQGNLFVADSMGVIFRVAPDKTVSEWFTDPAITGDSTSACASGLNLGANGIAVSGGKVYVTATDRAHLVAIPVQADGTAGTSTIVGTPGCGTLGGSDGLAADASGTLYIAQNGKDEVASVSAAGQITTLATGGLLQSPASIAVGPGAKDLYVTNFAFAEAQMGGAPAPGLIRIPIAP